MYIVHVHVGGRQFKIAPNDLIVINRIAADLGEKIYLEKVNFFILHLLHSFLGPLPPRAPKGVHCGMNTLRQHSM